MHKDAQIVMAPATMFFDRKKVSGAVAEVSISPLNLFHNKKCIFILASGGSVMACRLPAAVTRTKYPDLK